MSSKNAVRLERLESKPRPGRHILVGWLDAEPPSYTIDGELASAEEWEVQRPTAAVVINVRYANEGAR